MHFRKSLEMCAIIGSLHRKTGSGVNSWESTLTFFFFFSVQAFCFLSLFPAASGHTRAFVCSWKNRNANWNVVCV